MTCEENLILRCMGLLPYFSAIFTKGNNFCDFLSASLDKGAHPEYRSKFFPLRVDPLLKREAKNENGRVASPESLHLHLNAINEDQNQMLHPAGSDLGPQ